MREKRHFFLLQKQNHKTKLGIEGWNGMAWLRKKNIMDTRSPHTHTLACTNACTIRAGTQWPKLPYWPNTTNIIMAQRNTNWKSFLHSKTFVKFPIINAHTHTCIAETRAREREVAEGGHHDANLFTAYGIGVIFAPFPLQCQHLSQHTRHWFDGWQKRRHEQCEYFCRPKWVGICMDCWPGRFDQFSSSSSLASRKWWLAIYWFNCDEMSLGSCELKHQVGICIKQLNEFLGREKA